MTSEETCPCGATFSVRVAPNAFTGRIYSEEKEVAQQHLEDWKQRHAECANTLTKARRMFGDVHYHQAQTTGQANEADPTVQG